MKCRDGPCGHPFHLNYPWMATRAIPTFSIKRKVLNLYCQDRLFPFIFEMCPDPIDSQLICYLQYVLIKAPASLTPSSIAFWKSLHPSSLLFITK